MGAPATFSAEIASEWKRDVDEEIRSLEEGLTQAKEISARLIEKTVGTEISIPFNPPIFRARKRLDLLNELSFVLGSIINTYVSGKEILADKEKQGDG